MSTKTCGPAAHARALITGSKWSGQPKQRVNIRISRETLELAWRYKVCAISGRGGLLPIGQYLDDAIMTEVKRKREKEKLSYIGREDVQKTGNP